MQAHVQTMIPATSFLVGSEARNRMCQECGYDSIADEYYLQRHVTSRNFDAATAAYFAQHPFSPPRGLALDLDAGRGRLTEYLGVASPRIVQVDISLPMLMLSPRETSLGRVNADAHQLPFRPGPFALVGAFLFDPFNERQLFVQVARVLRRDGVFVGSLPHSTWGTTLRSVKSAPAAEATFVLRDGRPYSRPSFLSTEEDLKRNLADAGFLVRTMVALRLPRAVRDISPDVELPARVLGLSVYDLPLVQLFVAARS